MSRFAVAAPGVLPPPLHVGAGEPLLLWLLLAATAVTTLLFGLSLIVTYRRQNRRYLLVSATLAAFLSRSLVALLAVGGLLSANSHHLLEHGLDALIAIMLLAAVYDSTMATTDHRPNT